ncbi:hypothetical protein [Caulobacter soli]|uniref:hypothetical protein n=1 Tax=Caulobacter soli TaxID=2708539 RepID=UPI0013EDCCF4|nr:hypothetical protein [Caulobacter soli]
MGRRGAASAIRRTAATLAWLIGLLTGLGLAQSPAWALPQEALTPAAIKEFEQKLDTARAAQSVVAGRVVCFEQQDAALVKERDADQRRLGELVTHRRDLEAQTAQQREAYEGFRRLYDEERTRYDQIRQELDRLLAYRAAKEHALRECKRQFGPFGFMCDLSKEIGEITGLIQRNDNEINVAYRRIQDAEAGMTQANENYRQSAEALARTQEDTARTEREIRAAEASISRLQATLAVLRPEVHDNKVLLDEFADALREAKGVGRAPGARRVRTLAAQVDEATRKSDAVLAHAKTILTEQQFATCFR